MTLSTLGGIRQQDDALSGNEHARRGVPERWLLPPPPREPHLRARWESLDFEERRRLARSHLEDAASADIERRELLAALARARIAAAWRLYAAAAALGWLCLMTVWGIARTGEFPTAGLALGAAAGTTAWIAASLAAAQRLRRAQRLKRVAPRG